jgi:hypothetical protein
MQFVVGLNFVLYCCAVFVYGLRGIKLIGIIFSHVEQYDYWSEAVRCKLFLLIALKEICAVTIRPKNWICRKLTSGRCSFFFKMKRSSPFSKIDWFHKTKSIFLLIYCLGIMRFFSLFKWKLFRVSMMKSFFLGLRSVIKYWLLKG